MVGDAKLQEAADDTECGQLTLSTIKSIESAILLSTLSLGRLIKIWRFNRKAG